MRKLLLIFLIASNYSLNLAQAESLLNEIEKTEILAAHNYWRQTVNSPPLIWSADLAITAQNWADDLKNNQACKIQHSHNGLGENLYWTSPIVYSDGRSKPQLVSLKTVIDAWGNEKRDYDEITHRCAAGKRCGHYTQIVWKDSTHLGCAKTICTDYSQAWVCHYFPAGNVVGQTPY